ncbi:MAG: AMP-binding protein, partial [Myxococcales bacterium]|nr:AMP-binding protein [Myxococcales bacterium]
TLAVWYAGGAFVPLDPSYPSERLVFMCRDSQPVLVVSRRAVVETLPEDLRRVLPEVVLVDDPVAVDAVGAPSRGRLGGGAPGSPALDDLAYRIYTSGTTGQPKAVEVSHRNLAHTLGVSAARFGFGPGDLMLYAAAYSFDISLFESWGVLLAGGAVDLVTHDQILELEPLVERLERV